jgi:ribosomal protein S18 acetylase RimI-like enzyme
MIRPATPQDIAAIAAIDRESFSGNKPAGAAERWAAANFAQADKFRYFVAELEGKVVGFISWEIQGGFKRKNAVVELEGLAVAESGRGKGAGTALIAESLPLVKAWIKEINPDSPIMRVFLWTKKSNQPAIALYKKTFTKVFGERNIYDADEIMLGEEFPL